MTAFFRRSRFLIRLVCFSLTASIVGCQSQDLVGALADDIPLKTEAKIADIVHAIQASPLPPDEMVAALSRPVQTGAARGVGDDDLPTLTSAEAQELSDFYANPEPRLNDIYLNDDLGEERIDLLFSIYTQEDYPEIRENLENFLSYDQLLSVDAQVAEVEASMATLSTRAAGPETAARGTISNGAIHWMAGAAVTLLIAGIVYSVIPWWRPFGKIASAAAFGVVSGVLAGAMKEVYDSYHPASHTVDWRGDFLRTAGGSAAAGVFVVGTAAAARAVGLRPVTAAIFWVVTGVIIGRPVLLNLIRP